jgi:S-adenosylmethionine synthetase
VGEFVHVGVERGALDPGRQAFEVVERKGSGHPDTLCDAAAERFSTLLSGLYLERAGRILHHNVDKALVTAGQTRVHYGGGDWIAPITFRLAGRATTLVAGSPVPLDELGEQAVRETLHQVRHLAPDNAIARVEVRPSASDLVDLFDRSQQHPVPISNDTSIGVGFAPSTPCERVTLSIERMLGSPELQTRIPALGEDIKVMSVRREHGLDVTVAVAMVSRWILDSAAYRHAIEEVQAAVEAHVRSFGFEHFEVRVNAADELGRSEYLTLSGTSAEAGDDGQVGRGNRFGGLITPMRPMTLEAFAGKNPVTHVGKLYAVAATRAAEACADLLGVRSAECYLVSRIGSPITEPQAVHLRLDASESTLAEIRNAASEIARREIEQLPLLWKEILASPLEAGGGSARTTLQAKEPSS